MRLERQGHTAGAVDEVAESSSTLGEGQRHNDLLKLSSPETDATQQVVCHSSPSFSPLATSSSLPCRYEFKWHGSPGVNTPFQFCKGDAQVHVNMNLK